MTLKEGYDRMYRILDNYWINTGKRNLDLADMLSGFDTRIFRDIKGNRVPGDPGAWQDWVKAVRSVTARDEITEEESFLAMVNLLKEYNDHHGFDLAEVIDHFSQQNIIGGIS